MHNSTSGVEIRLHAKNQLPRSDKNGVGCKISAYLGDPIIFLYKSSSGLKGSFFLKSVSYIACKGYYFDEGAFHC